MKKNAYSHLLKPQKNTQNSVNQDIKVYNLFKMSSKKVAIIRLRVTNKYFFDTTCLLITPHFCRNTASFT